MSIDNSISEYLSQFNKLGVCELTFEDSLKQVIKDSGVPNEPGVYLIMAESNSGDKELIYIGKSGTLNNDGSFKPQGIAVRLTKKQEGIYRQEYFRQIIRDNDYKKLKIYWVVTYNETRKLIPQKAEGDIMQLYYDIHGKLPKYNKTY